MLFIQGVVSIVVLCLLLKLNRTITVAEQTFRKETATHVQLQKTLDSVQYVLNTFENVTSRPFSDTLKKGSVTLNKPVTKTPPLVVTKKSSGNGALYNDNSRFSVESNFYEYHFLVPIHLGAISTITTMNGQFIVYSTKSDVPYDIKASITVKETQNELRDKVTQIHLELVKATISPDFNINCIFSEMTKDSINEYGLPEYQRKLNFTLSGSLKNSTIDGELTWKELSGRPMWAKFNLRVDKL